LANGELSDVASVDFAIAYPLLMRWYMVVLYFIAFAYLIYLLFRFRLKKLQKDKIKLERIVEERTADLRNAQQELIRHEKMASVGKLTEGLIDRILNPMNYIINFSKMSIDLLKDLKDDIGRNKENINEDDYQDTEDVLGMLTDNLTNVDHYGQNASHMLKAMEEMLKDRTGGYLDMDLRTVLQQSVQMFDSYFAKEKAQYGIQTVFTLPDDAMLIHGNPDMLNKTVMNMLSNAVYAVVRKAQRTDFQPEISLVASMAEGCYVLKIRDNGIGIEETIIGKVFDPFFTTKTTDEGTGIGLYLGREIVQNHGGDISVVSVKDDYTEFTVTLPKLQEKR
jgi:signal transduction histidine kinase